jgi:hypothetical protein
VRPIENMHIHEDAPVRSTERAYDRTYEELDDDDYDEVANEHGEENKNTHGCNGHSDNPIEGGACGNIVGDNTDAAFVGSGDGGPNKG